MLHTELASQSDMHLEAINGDGPEVRWCIFTKGKRGPIAKIIVDTRPKKVQDAHYAPTAHIVNVHVNPSYRGKRLGEHLVRLAQGAMKTNGFTWMTLEAEENVEHHGKLVGLYQRCGFEIYPPSDTFPLEYNGDECFRKVPMRCNLSEMVLDGPVTMSPKSSTVTTTTTTTPPPIPPTPMIDIAASKYANALFVQEMRREAQSLLVSTPLNVTVQMALDWIDLHLVSGSMEMGLRTGMVLRSRGHPDWMELAGYLRFLGLVQEKWTDWRAPFMVSIENAGQDGFTIEPARQSDDEEDDPAGDMDYLMTKSGPLPKELSGIVTNSTFIDPERYAQEGVDEALMMWTPNEFAFLALTVGDRSSAPREMAQMLRYSTCNVWLDTEEFKYLESFGDSDVKSLTIEFRDAMMEADRSSTLDVKQMEEAKTRLTELIEKYVADVRLM